MTTILVSLAIWTVFSVPFGIACGTWMKRCDMLEKRSVSDVSDDKMEARRRGDVNHAHNPNIK